MSYPQQPPSSYQPYPSGANMDPFASPRNSVGSAYSHNSQGSVGSGMAASVGGTPYASYAQGPRPAPSILSDGPYAEHSRSGSRAGSAMSHYNVAVDPAGWTTKPEADDFLHDPRSEDKGRFAKGLSRRGLMNIGCLVLVILLIVGGAVAYPLVRHFTNKNKGSTDASTGSALNTANLPNISSWSLIDVATPQDAYTIPSYHDPSKTMKLVFSDEFETDGRSFYPGDDPYWEAVDLHYWQTGDLEWYDPSAVTTKNGALEITLSQIDDISLNHNLSYRSGMISSWNKFCFTGGILVSSVTLPGTTNVLGLWPAVWAMGNLGRAGYGASLDGMVCLRSLSSCHSSTPCLSRFPATLLVFLPNPPRFPLFPPSSTLTFAHPQPQWPYSYDTCDVGTLPNQTLPDNSGPQAAFDTGGNNKDAELSFLPGQRLSACTCAGESHPGPTKSDGSFVGRSAPEIDVFEATIGGPSGALIGQVSQSAQWAPFDASYKAFNSTDNMIIPNPSITAQNAFVGNVFQQTTSALSNTNQDCYQLKGQCFSTYGFEYTPGYADAYISWITDDKLVWTMNGNMVGADTQTEIGARQVPVEPMYVIMNLGLSESFGTIDFEHLTFPAVMRIDWVRVYQDPDNVQVGCNPADYPTADYINEYMEAYTNPNLTTWVDDFHQVIPKNRLADTC
ncbi:GH16 domain-containing protein [Mycena sanguinolenta]|uniref:GH16 domain-containing protein n=1 Tax=Mycena sanguinolenta TaxID=230812 RepID=A0A8H6XAZ7_9AGAR|nr:GH16 domain-containing protein [Mycena sanguinolenta]